MIKRVLTALFIAIMFFAFAPSTFAATRYTRSQREYIRHRRHHKTVKRVGIGALGGAAIGALAGKGKGAIIGGAAGAGAGYLYDRDKKHHGHY